MLEELPQQLRDADFRFCLVRRGEKGPFEYGWQDTNNYAHDDARLKEHILKGGSYGVIGGYGNLVVIDFDDADAQEQYLPLLPKTFCVKSGGKGLIHAYFKTDEKVANFFIDSADGKRRLIDVQAQKKQVVGPGSTHQSGKEYTVAVDAPIALVTKEQLYAALGKNPEMNAFAEKYNIEKRDDDDIVKQIKSKQSIRQMLIHYGIDNVPDTNNGICMCPLGHDSEKRMCFHYDDTAGLWYCHHCKKGGSIIDLVAFKMGLDPREDFPKVKRELANKLGIQETDDKTRILDLWYDKDTKELAIKELADYIVKHHHIKCIRNDAINETWYFLNGIWVPEGGTYIQQIIFNDFNPMCSLATFSKTLQLIQQQTFIDAEEFFNANSDDTDHIVVENGVLNVRTKELMPYDPTKFMFAKVPITYDPAATCPKIQKFLREVVHEHDAVLLEEAIGYMLYKSNPLQTIIVLTGQGANGKSVVINLMQAFIGPKNCINIEPKLLKDRFNMALLHNKLACLSSDISGEKLETLSFIKTIVGGDRITADRKHKSSISFSPYAKFIYSANELPEIMESNRGAFRRWLMIDFRNIFLSQQEIDMIPVDKRQNIFVKDSFITEKLTSTKELSGLLNLAITRLNELLARNQWNRKESTEEKMQEMQLRGGSFEYFLTEFTISEVGWSIPKDEMRSRYHEFCALHNMSPISDKAMRKKIDEHFGHRDMESRITRMIENKEERVRVWNNINWVMTNEEWTAVMAKQKTININPKDEVSKILTVVAAIENICSVLHKQDVSYEELVDVLGNEKVVDNQLARLLSSGDVYCPRPGHYKILK